MISPVGRHQNGLPLERTEHPPQPGSFQAPSSCPPPASKGEAWAARVAPLRSEAHSPRTCTAQRVTSEHRRNASRAIGLCGLFMGTGRGVKGCPETRTAPGSIGGLLCPTWPAERLPRKGVERSGRKGEAGHESKRPKWGGCHRRQLAAAGLRLDGVERSLRGFRSGAPSCRAPCSCEDLAPPPR